MFFEKKKSQLKSLFKVLRILACMAILGTVSCNGGTNSTTSSAGSSGTGTGWTITIQIGTNPLPFTGYSTTTVMAIVKDRTGAAAPFGTNVCMTAVLNGFISSGSTTLYATLCETTKNNLGQSINTYKGALSAGDDTIEVSSQGVIATATIHNN